VKFCGEPAQDIELNAGLVSVFSGNGLVDLDTFFCEEIGSGLSCSFPAVVEPGDVTAPGIELREWRQFWMIAKELD
jgi:hypothetical protein